jgi:hypothetical protein
MSTPVQLLLSKAGQIQTFQIPKYRQNPQGFGLLGLGFFLNLGIGKKGILVVGGRSR